MDIRKVKKLMELLERSDMSEIEIKEGEESVRIVRYSKSAAETVVAAAPITATQSTITAPEVTDSTPPIPDGHPITSPIVGTFYSAASPDTDAFVQIGQRVSQGDTVCIIEAMKIMNQIPADQSGTVKKILCNDGDAIEFGQTLVIIE